MGGIGETIYEQLSKLAQIRLNLHGLHGVGTPVSTGRWAKFLQDLSQHQRWIQTFCAPAAALIVLLDIELHVMSLVELPRVTCGTLARGISELKALKLVKLQDYNQRLRMEEDANFHGWQEILTAAEQTTFGVLDVVHCWGRRCQQLKDTSPVALACWHPFEAPIPGADHVCIAGLSELGRASSSSFWHFMRGFFVEVFRALLKRWTPQQIRSLRLQFGDLTYPCDHRNRFMAFFGALVEHPVTVDPGCELSRKWHLPVVALGSVPDIARGAGAGGGCEVQTMRRHVFSLLGGQRRQNILVHVKRGLSTASRRPTNAMMVRRAAQQACGHSRLSCRLDTILEDLSWLAQLKLLSRSKAIVAYHGSAVGAAQFWLRPGAVVLEFMPSGCWWCLFAVAASNFSRPRLTWLVSTTGDAPLAEIPGTSHPLIGCDDQVASFQTFGERRDLQRHVGLRGFHVLRRVLRRGRRAALSQRDAMATECHEQFLVVASTLVPTPLTFPDSSRLISAKPGLQSWAARSRAMQAKNRQSWHEVDQQAQLRQEAAANPETQEPYDAADWMQPAAARWLYYKIGPRSWQIATAVAMGVTVIGEESHPGYKLMQDENHSVAIVLLIAAGVKLAFLPVIAQPHIATTLMMELDVHHLSKWKEHMNVLSLPPYIVLVGLIKDKWRKFLRYHFGLEIVPPLAFIFAMFLLLFGVHPRPEVLMVVSAAPLSMAYLWLQVLPLASFNQMIVDWQHSTPSNDIFRMLWQKEKELMFTVFRYRITFRKMRLSIASLAVSMVIKQGRTLFNAMARAFDGPDEPALTVTTSLGKHREKQRWSLHPFGAAVCRADHGSIGLVMAFTQLARSQVQAGAAASNDQAGISSPSFRPWLDRRRCNRPVPPLFCATWMPVEHCWHWMRCGRYRRAQARLAWYLHSRGHLQFPRHRLHSVFQILRNHHSRDHKLLRQIAVAMATKPDPWRCKYCMRMVSGASHYCGGCHGHWDLCFDATYVHKQHVRDKRQQQGYAQQWTHPPWEEDSNQWRHAQQERSPRRRTSSPRQRSGSARGGNGKGYLNEQNTDANKGKQKGQEKGKASEKGGAVAFGHLPPSSQWMQPPEHPFPKDPAGPSMTSTSPAMQPFGKSRAEKDKDEAELIALRHLASKVKHQQEEQSEEVKKALAAVEANTRKDDAKSYHQLVSSVKTAKKRLLDIEEQWEAFRSQWTQYLDKATKMWTAHIDSYEEGENKFAEKRQEAADHLQQVRGQLHAIHVRTMEGTVTKGELQEGQTALDATMLIEEMDNVAAQPQFCQLKTDLKGAVQRVCETIEEKMGKRSMTSRSHDGDMIDLENQPAEKKQRDSD
eukprot:s1980_g12.t6